MDFDTLTNFYKFLMKWIFANFDVQEFDAATPSLIKWKLIVVFIYEAGATFDNSFFDNSFGFLRQFKNRSFLDPVFVHATGRRQN
jgi:hypothetical protein